jgi:hypothetical protein
MKQKPLLFKILMILCLIEPVIKVFYFKALTHFDFSVIFSNLMARTSPLEIFDFWLVFPLAGLALLKIRKISYFIFLGLLAYVIYTFVTYESYTWPYNSETPFFYNQVVVVIAFITFIAFLIPQVRRPFFDKRVRWWEPKTRYIVNIACRVQGKNIVFPSELLDISKTGAFLKESSYFNIGDDLSIEFKYMNMNFNLPVKVISQHVFRGQAGAGVQFRFQSLRQNLDLAKFIGLIKGSHQKRT